jgi:lipopolysaccharide/colanic/teichoic acid biosynthesis glycosyltransferase
MLRSLVERCLAFVAVVLFLPVLGIAALAVWADSGRPVLFRQRRSGRGGRDFHIVKFRTMRAEVGASITAENDSRITRIGQILRRYKIDELPQLWNVVRGDMQFVGPRPEVPGFVTLDDPNWQAALSVRPGITDPATLLFRNEEQLLAHVPDALTYYKQVVLPRKLQLSTAYQRNRTFWSDLVVLVLTAFYSMVPSRWSDRHLRRYCPMEV